MSACEQFGLNYTIFRPHNVYGERQNLNDKYRNVVGIFIRNKLKGTKAKIFGDGHQERAFTYVKDIIPVIVQAHSNEKMKNEIFNIGSDTNVSINYLAACLALETEYEPSRHEVNINHPVHDKIKSVTEMPRETPLIDGIYNMYEWAKTQKLTDHKLFTDIEISKLLPQSWINQEK